MLQSLDYYIWRIDGYLNRYFESQTLVFLVVFGGMACLEFARYLLEKYYPSNRNRCPWCGHLISRPLPLLSRRLNVFWRSHRCAYCKHLFRADVTVWTWLCYMMCGVAFVYSLYNAQPIWCAFATVYFCLCPEFLFGHLYGYPLQKDFESGTPHCEGVEYAYSATFTWKKTLRCPFKPNEIYPICFVNNAGSPKSDMICVRLEKLKKLNENCCAGEILFLLYGLPVPNELATSSHFYLYENKKIIGIGTLR